MRFGSDLVTPPANAGANTPNSAYTVKTGFFGSQPTSSVVTSSSSAGNYVNNLGTNINTAGTSSPNAYTTDNPYGTPKPYDYSSDTTAQTDVAASNKAYEDYRTALQAQRDAEIASIKQEQGSETSKLGATQKNESATSSRNLLYMQQGGQSASAQAYLVSLESSHRAEMDTLTAKYNSAIDKASTAYSAKDFEAAQKELTAAQSIKNDAYKRNQDFLDYTLKLRTQANDDLKTQYALGDEQRKQAADIRQFALDNGLSSNSRFVAIGGQIFDTTTWRSFDTKDAALAAGVSADLSNVQMIQSKEKYSSGVLGEYEKYLEDVAAGKSSYLTFNQYSDMDANRKAKVAKAGASTTTILDQSREYDLRVKQAAAQVRTMQQGGYSWAQIADYMTNLGIDPGTVEVDDALHRAFNSSDQYAKWKTDQAKTKKGVTEIDRRTDKKTGLTTVYYSDGSSEVVK